MSDTAALASLSLTHVNYVRKAWPQSIQPQLINQGPDGSDLLLLRMAGAGATRALRCIRNINMVDAGSGNPADVCRTDGL